MELMKTLAKELDETLGGHPAKTIILIVCEPARASWRDSNKNIAWHRG